MKDMTIAYVNPQVIKWARERVGLSVGELAEQFSRLQPSDILDWESGKARPTMAQAEDLANKLKVPFLVLFKSSPPEINLPIPDLRTMAGRRATNLSPNFFDVVTDCLLKQHWYKARLLEEGTEPLDFCDKFTLKSGVKAVAEDIVNRLGLDSALRTELRDWESFLSHIAKMAESIGIIVIRNSQVRFASRRPLDPEEFRGFALTDPIAPLVFINTKDVPPARIFTLVHELVHIWIGKTGISNTDPRVYIGSVPNEIERFCNAVAAEVLMPENEFRSAWRDDESVYSNLSRISRFFRVSVIAALIRARDADIVSFPLAEQLIDAEYDKIQKSKEAFQEEEEGEEEGGPTFWTMFGPRASRLLLSRVVRGLKDHKVTYLDAASLIGVKLRTLDSYLAKLKA
jgi:Zn-dependent peptidase ImmA (M78 family)